MGTLPFTSSPLLSPPEAKTPNRAGRTLPMAEFLPLLPCAPLLTQDGGAQDSPVPPAKWQSQQPQGGRAQGLASKPWRLPEVPSIQITPASDGDSPPCTPAEDPRPGEFAPGQVRPGWWDGKGVLSLGTHRVGSLWLALQVGS